MIGGATPELVGRAIETRDSLPGTRGFAGELPDGRLVRDVLGRHPLFVDGDLDAAGDTDWSFDHRDLADPTSVPAGIVLADGERRQVWTLPDPDPVADEQEAVGAVREAISAALSDAPDAAVAFSGGVDSSVVAAGTDGPLYVAGFPDSHDLEAATDAGRALDRDLRVVELSLSTVEDAVPRVARAIGRTNAMDVSIALPLFLVGERAAADGAERLAVGQGADELFGGYAKVAKAPSDPRVDAETVRRARREVVTTLPDQLERDVQAVRAAGVEPVAPLLDDRVIAAALALPGNLLVDDRGERKVALRRAARELVPARVAFREKKAVQYGSNVSRELDRLARQAGFKRRMDDHVSQYIRARLENTRG
ncbi:asparagine synthase [Halobacteriales archaeon QS_1_68_20]|nr:MAG: asparagine synthase [Halobacteriales archaeon QS_1_68_20]